MVALSNVKPISSLITVPPVNTAISSKISFRLSPNAGALTAATLREPLILFTTNAPNASPSTSSAIINKGLFVCAVDSKIGRISFNVEIRLS